MWVGAYCTSHRVVHGVAFRFFAGVWEAEEGEDFQRSLNSEL